MSEAPEQPDPKLERLLRQWGTEEAAARAPVGPAPKVAVLPPAPVPGRLPSRERAASPWLWRAAAGAVAACAIAASVLLWARWSEARDDATALGRDKKSLEGSVAALKDQLSRARAATTLTMGEQEERMALLDREANRAMETAAALKRRLALADADLAARDANLAKAGEELASWKKKVDDEAAKVTAAIGDANQARQRLAAATGEMERARSLYEDAQAAVKKSQNDLDELKAGQAAVWADFRQAYLAVAAPGESGLRASQAAVKRSQLVARCGKLRAAAESSQRPLLDKLEVVLTRLEMVEPGTFVSEDLFHKLLASSEVIKGLDEALAARNLLPEARSVYFEARLILGGADRVG